MKEQMFFVFFFSPGISTGHKNAEKREHHWFEKIYYFFYFYNGELFFSEYLDIIQFFFLIH